jgi:mRNA-degrading endonuclease RelE of RelBE toxin-antitoxin system
MSSEISVKLARAAKKDLQGLGRFRARVLGRALQDELRTAVPSLSVEPIREPDWQALEIGDYRVIYRLEPAVDQDQPPTHLVGRILDREDFDAARREDRLAESLPTSDASDLRREHPGDDQSDPSHIEDEHRAVEPMPPELL